MSRYIDAEKLGIGTARPKAFVRPEYAVGWNSAIGIIKNAPTADVEEVRHGKWKKIETRGNCETKAQCSACGDTVIYWCQPYNYCPNCGAKMDGGD